MPVSKSTTNNTNNKRKQEIKNIKNEITLKSSSLTSLSNQQNNKKLKIDHNDNDNNDISNSSSDDDDDDMIGPSLPLPPSSSSSSSSSTSNSNIDNNELKKKSHISHQQQHHQHIINKRNKKKRERENRLLDDKIFLNKLPDFPFYSLSFMHRQQITIIRVHQPQQQQIDSSSSTSSSSILNSNISGSGKQSEFIITGSLDGRIMFWNKMKSSIGSSSNSTLNNSNNNSNSTNNDNDTIGRIEFVKEFKAHRGPVVDAVLSPDGRFLATISGLPESKINDNGNDNDNNNNNNDNDNNTINIIDKTIKIFDVLNFDMINFIELKAPPQCICWISSSHFLVSLKNSSDIHIYNLDSETPEIPQHIISHLHKQPIKILGYNSVLDCVISIDSVGMIEYWRPNNIFLSSTTTSRRNGTGNNNDIISKPIGNGWFELKSSTNLYDFRKTKNIPTSLTISPNGKYFTTFSLPDRKIRIFDFMSGKLLREYDESLQTLSDLRRLESVGKGVELENEKLKTNKKKIDLDKDKNKDEDDEEEENNDDEATDIKSMEKMDDSLFEQKLQRDKRLIEDEYPEMTRYLNVLFDQSCRYIIFSSAIGIKIVNIQTNKLVRTLGAGEHKLRFLNLALYQGFNRSSDSGKLSLEAAASDNRLIERSFQADPVLFATAFETPRFFLFSRLRDSDNQIIEKNKENKSKDEDEDNNNDDNENNNSNEGEDDEDEKSKMPQNVKLWIKMSHRDIFNQRPANSKDSSSNSDTSGKKKHNGNNLSDLPPILRTKAVILHTTLGDIRLTFYPKVAPMAVENFVTLCKQGYYNNTIFHRVIKGFMIQGGDPEGDGTGGESMWTESTGNPHFKDEFDKNKLIKHDRPFRLSMANAGPNTNGSQFFITTAAAPWLDGKHSIFGQIAMTDGAGSETSLNTVRSIEALETNKNDCPLDPPQIISTSIES